MIYSDNPFAESVKIADYLREHTSRDDTIAVLGSEPEIYFMRSGIRRPDIFILTA